MHSEAKMLSEAAAAPAVSKRRSGSDRYRMEVMAPVGNHIHECVESICRDTNDPRAPLGWSLVSMVCIPVSPPPESGLPRNAQVPGIMAFFEPRGSGDTAGAEDDLAQTLRSLHDAVRASLPFCKVEGRLREQLDATVAAAGGALGLTNDHLAA